MSKDFNNLKLSIDLLPKSELSQDKGTTQEKFFNIFVNQFEDIDFTASQIRFLLDFEKNTGVNLDIVGILLGILRNELSDDDFKIVLDIIANDAKPGAVNINRTFKNLMQAGSVNLSEFFPAAFLLDAVGGVPIIDISIIAQIVQSLNPEGIKLFLNQVPADAFRFDVGSGFGDDTDAGIGGGFAAII